MEKSVMVMSACLMALLMLTSCGNKTKGEKVELSGSGASFPQPFYGVVFEQYGNKSGNEV
ncbi:MAG: phosphate ABC transporter substrate-binding protein PstS, partial [Bacteroidales bacterium]|nr:phosphate ABC transporter substrate-binding protein PstS [Bacteroidales bacterium]